MAKEIVWTLRSIQDRIQIYQYWLERNKSATYSSKLESIFQITANLISNFPEVGVSTNIPEVRVKVVRTFKLIYQVQKDRIVILRVWDTRQNPENLEIQ